MGPEHVSIPLVLFAAMGRQSTRSKFLGTTIRRSTAPVFGTMCTLAIWPMHMWRRWSGLLPAAGAIPLT